ncbi:hypothetical protein AQ490_03545 [Wenjunlia vitaminophila]|uniref:Alanine-rich protein n=1 Tax=Wenjunlia vitaminophila TaxID=76728 RepID=A0A0T6LTE1_WENVI|nr:hypothetical protein [Wenjunlia vitaminophila]KRV49280.1 hypothetical protein AQ490_03545 [Wenjunlia vitaminophila]
MRASAFLYPWDVIADPGAPRRLAESGVQQVTLASAYHSVRALTPRHPRHRVVTARHHAVYYPPDPARWAGRALRPHPQAWVPVRDAFDEAAGALAAAGLAVHSWVVLAHNSRLGAEHPRATVRNAYGDRYPWALCVGQPEVREYLVELAAEAAVRPGALGTELESCGWYGLGHLHAHDKIGGVPLGAAAQYLMSVCFCRHCRNGYHRLGVDPEELRRAVVGALEPLWAGAPEPAAGDRAGEWAAVGELLGRDLAAVTLAHRTAVAGEFQRTVVRAVRSAAPGGFRVLLHADPAPHRCGANAGVSAADVLAEADGLVLPCTDAADREAVLTAADVPARRAGTVLAANLVVVAGMGGRPDALAEAARQAATHGAGELRLYHAGLASDRDWAEVTRQLAALRRRPGGRPAPTGTAR